MKVREGNDEEVSGNYRTDLLAASSDNSCNEHFWPNQEVNCTK